MKNRKYYLAYGSNLNIDQMAYRCPSAKIEGIATLRDYRLLFRGSGTGAYLTIEPCPGASVPCGVWSISPQDEASLDRYEGFPVFYRKETMRVEIQSEAFAREVLADALVYIMDGNRPLGVPSQTYLHTVGAGYFDFGFDFEPLEDALSYSRALCGQKEVI